MQWTKFLQTWEGTRAENRFNRLVIAGLIVLVLVFGSVALMKNDCNRPAVHANTRSLGYNK